MTSLVDLYFDGHVHTSMCHHAIGEMEDYVQSAIQKGLKKLCFLEHFEIGINYFESTWLSSDDFRAYFEQGEHLKETYADTLDICIGVEVGYNPNALEQTLDFLKQHQWDRVGLSYHFYEETGRHLNMLSRKKVNWDAFSRIGVASVLSGYLDGLLTAVQQIPAQVLCHLDAALRFHPDVYFNRQHHQQICTLLDLLARQNMALEINTSGFVHRGKPYPQEWILEKAIKKNIQLCLGSDAHHPKDVGRYFERIPSFLENGMSDS